MKKINLILTALTIVCAASSALASKLFLVNPVWVNGVTTFGQYTCSTVATDCSNTGTRNCEVRIQLSTGVVKSTNGYLTNVCTMVLKQPSATAIKQKPNLQDVAPYFP